MNFAEIKKLWESKGRGEPVTAIEIYMLAAILYETNERGRGCLHSCIAKRIFNRR